MGATGEASPFTRWVVLAALSMATAVMFAVSLRGNFLFGYSIGQTDEKRLLFGWANVAADTWKAFGLIAVAMLWRTKHRRAAVLASLAWLTCLLFGINSALGIYVQDRATLIGTREAQHATYTDVEKELAGIEARLRGRAPQRSVGEVDAAIDALLRSAVMVGHRVRGSVGELSHDCTKVDARTKEACADVARLREEHAAAREVGDLEQRAGLLRRQLITLRDRGSSVAVDPVGELYAWLTGGFVSVRAVGFGFPLFFALVIEVVSAFGPVTIAAYAEASRGSAGAELAFEAALKLGIAGHDRLGPATAGQSEPEDGHVVLWIAERAVPTSDSSAIGVVALYEDYALWCAETGNRPGALAVFEQQFDRVRALPDLAGKIRKFRDRYYGVGLVRRERRSLAAARGT